MAPSKKKVANSAGLGRAIINQKSKDVRRAQESILYTTDIDPSTRLQSVTEERDLDEFLNTARLAATDFIAERQNISVIQTPSATASSAHNPFLLSDQEEKQALEKHRQNKGRLRVPRRPAWTHNTTHAQLERQEHNAFLEWRRGLAQLQEEMGLLLTPFERNLEVWRQLWRVLERSHLVVQIVDARNPLRFRCEDLEEYVRDLDSPEDGLGSGTGKRKTLLLINKADLLTAKQRHYWADYFDEQRIDYAFYSAADAVALQEARESNAPEDDEQHVERSNARDDHHGSADGSSTSEFDNEEPGSTNDIFEDERFGAELEDGMEEGECLRTKVLSVVELESLFLQRASDLALFSREDGNTPQKLVVGLVGYPNVGKSSTINSFLGEKKVSVSSTPGKTKHFQTIHLSSSIMLCDSPGLVFPQFATTKADLVCDGVLPIDQLREYTGPTSLVAKRIPKAILEATYGLDIPAASHNGTNNDQITTEDLLLAYATARGFSRAGQGHPDEARAARYILKDYVNAKLLYCHPPPGISEEDFNAQAQGIFLQSLAKPKRAPSTRVAKDADTFVSTPESGSGMSKKARSVDESFFATGSKLSARPFIQGSARHGQFYTRTNIYPHQNIVNDDGTPLEGRRARVAAILAANGVGIDGKREKKHFKGNKRVKQRSGKGYD